MISAPLARGPFLFAIVVLSPATSSPAGASLLVNLAAAQERKVPADTPDTGTSLSALRPDTSQAAGALALVLVITSSVVLIAIGLNLSEPAALQAFEAAGGSASAGYNNVDQWIGIALMGAGAVLARRARRLTAVDVHRLMQHDTRPPVLYLRSFGDDALKLWTATFGRSSLLERFTPRRFDAFEEVIARHLSLTGPVIALNPPDTSLPPLGAARETLDSAEWQSTISEWMNRSAVIVFIMPPGKVTSGLTWEVQQVSAHQYWTKTLIIIPPVRASLLQARWHGFLAVCSTAWPFTIPLPTAVPKPLTLTFGNDTWTAVRANRQDEWTYSAAIKEALSGLPPTAETVQNEPDPRRGYPSGTTS